MNNAERLSLSGRRWRIAPRLSPEDLGAVTDLPPLAVQLLHNRGLRDADAIGEFIAGGLPPHDPFLMDGMEAAAARLLRAVAAGERVCIYSDYDADGVTSCSVLTLALHSLGLDPTAYFPDRRREGYGLNQAAIAAIAAEGVNLLISTDCGANAVAEVESALAAGMDVIVTDHHTVVTELPAAAIALNPHNPGEGYPFPDLAGVGVAYKLAEAVLMEAESPEAIEAESLLDLVALGTVADVVPLRDENRLFVLEGLQRMNAGSRPAMKALINAARLTPGDITSTDLGYRLGPRINAAGRMDDARIAYRLLTGDDPVANDRLALELEELNRRRQQATKDVLAAAQEFATANGPVFAYGDDWHPGVIGLVAGRLAEASGRPAFVASVRDGVAQGSARSPEGFSVVAALSACHVILDRHGGHPRAGGFTLAGDRLEEFATALREQWSAAGAPTARPAVEADCRLRPESITWDTLQLVQDLEPYGQGFPAPLFAASGLRLVERHTVGGDHSHLRPVFAGLTADLSAIWFGGGAHVGALQPGHDYDVAFRLARSIYQGQTRLDMLIEDVRAAG